MSDLVIKHKSIFYGIIKHFHLFKETITRNILFITMNFKVVLFFALLAILSTLIFANDGGHRDNYGRRYNRGNGWNKNRKDRHDCSDCSDDHKGYNNYHKYH